MKPVILTGLRANENLHLGNYLGAILPVVSLQHKYAGDYQVNMFVPDLHSFTTPVDHGTLYKNTIDNIRVFIAAGLDISNKDTFIYRQSYIPAHSELTWILDCFTYMGELNRMTQFKEKAEKKESASVGLFNYPVLMAADILLYRAEWVPVGEDQRQHLELARDLALRMNNKFGEIFTPPKPWDDQLKFSNRTQGARIRSLKNPTKKMSKSVEDPAGTIKLTDSPNEAKKKIMSATTDTLGKVHFDWVNQPGVTNLLQILVLLSKLPKDDVLGQWEDTTSYGDLKKAVADSVGDFLTRFQSDFGAVDVKNILGQLDTDERKMRESSDKLLRQVQQAVGLRPT